MSETIWWCESHRVPDKTRGFDPNDPKCWKRYMGQPPDSCDIVERVLSVPGELVDPANVDYEAALRQWDWSRESSDDGLLCMKDAVDAALGVEEPGRRERVMDGLRSLLIEAGAEAMYDGDDSYTEKWEYQAEDVRNWYRGMAEFQIEAFLGVLEAHADEWRKAATPPPNHTTGACWANTRGLLAVLRGGEQ